MSKVFTRRELNRATLQRQMLLRREDVPAVEAVERLAGLNAQDPRPPYLSLWARLAGFELDDLTKLLYDRSVVRSSMMRGTQHMVAAQDYLAWRPLLQPLMGGLQRFFGRATTGVDLAELAATARELLTGQTLTRPELGRLLAEHWPSAEPAALASSVQFLVPLIHPPPSGTWGQVGCHAFRARRGVDRPSNEDTHRPARDDQTVPGRLWPVFCDGCPSLVRPYPAARAGGSAWPATLFRRGRAGAL